MGWFEDALVDKKKGYSIQYIADKYNKSTSTVSNRLSINKRENKIIENVKKSKYQDKDQMSLILLMSDCHFGKKTKSTNMEVLERRTSYLKHGLIEEYTKLSSWYNINSLNIFLLGDIIDNDSIYPTHKHHTDDDARFAREQCNKSANILVPFIKDIDRHTDDNCDTNVRGVRGNHGRTGKYAHESNNWDLVLYDKIKDRLDDTDIDVDCSDEFYQIVPVEDKNFFLYHGARIRAYQNIPWYGAYQRVLKLGNTLDTNFDYVCLGHFHSFGFHTCTNKQIFMNGCMVSDDDYALENLGLDGNMMFHLLGIVPGEGVKYRIVLEME